MKNENIQKELILFTIDGIDLKRDLFKNFQLYNMDIHYNKDNHNVLKIILSSNFSLYGFYDELRVENKPYNTYFKQQLFINTSNLISIDNKEKKHLICKILNGIPQNEQKQYLHDFNIKDISSIDDETAELIIINCNESYFYYQELIFLNDCFNTINEALQLNFNNVYYFFESIQHQINFQNDPFKTNKKTI